VRPLAGYEMPDYLRVTIGLKEENARFLQVLKEATQ
jgi:histidinol-phosphate aminotransferase